MGRCGERSTGSSSLRGGRASPENVSRCKQPTARQVLLQVAELSLREAQSALATATAAERVRLDNALYDDADVQSSPTVKRAANKVHAVARVGKEDRC